MPTYKVRCGMRPHSGQFPAPHAGSTMVRTVTVEARNVEEARAEAIDECYRRWGNSIEHVRPGLVELIEGD